MRKESPSQNKSLWEILVMLTPLILGIGVTGVGVLFTNLYNHRQLQLSQVELLGKYRDLLQSKNDFDRAFAYETFSVLGYRDMAVRLIANRQDPAGRNVLREAEKAGAGSTQVEAKAALKILPSKVYIHTTSATQNVLVGPLRMTLEEKGFVVADDIQDVSGIVGLPKKANVRYFNNADKETAKTVVGILEEQKIPSYPVLIGGYNTRPGSIEIWFGAASR